MGVDTFSDQASTIRTDDTLDDIPLRLISGGSREDNGVEPT